MKTKTLLVLFISLLLNACATTQQYQRNLDTWIGKPSSLLLNRWGTPTKTYELGSSVFYEYTSVGSTTAMGQYVPMANAYMVTSNTNWCRTTFEVDGQGVIKAWHTKGNSCRA